MANALALPRHTAEQALRDGHDIDQKPICLLQPPAGPRSILRWSNGASKCTSEYGLEELQEDLEEHLDYIHNETGLYVPNRKYAIERAPNEERLALYSLVGFVDGAILSDLEHRSPRIYAAAGRVVVDALRQYRGWAVRQESILYDISHDDQYTYGVLEGNDREEEKYQPYLHDVEPLFASTFDPSMMEHFDINLAHFERSVDLAR